MKIFTPSIFSFLLLGFLCLFVNQEVNGQWELLLGGEGENWGIGSTDDTKDESLVMVVWIDGNKTLMRVNIFGQIVFHHSFTELGLPNEGINHITIQALKDQGYLLYYGNGDGEHLAKLNPYGKIIWIQTIDFQGKIIELESGNYLQIISGEIENTPEEQNRDVILTAISGKNGNILWRKVYGSEADEEIIRQKSNQEGGYIIAGKSDKYNAFLMEFSEEWDSIGGYTYDFEGEGAEYYWWEDEVEEEKYSLEDIAITEENGIIASMVSSKLDSLHDWSFAYLVVEKIDALGNREWRNEYEHEEDAYDGFSFTFLSDYHINSKLNGNYLIDATWRLEWYRHPFMMEITPTGEPVWYQNYYFEYPIYNYTGAYCGVGALINDIQEVEESNLWATGQGFYDLSIPISTDWNSHECNYPSFLTKVNVQGDLEWTKFFDLGDVENYIFEYSPSIFSQNESCYFVTSALNACKNERLGYIIHTNNEGKSTSNLLSGQIFLDSNENCQYNETERSLYEGIVINIESPLFNYQTLADFNGNFSAEIPIGEYTISYTLDNDLVESTCGESQYSVNFTENYDTISNLNFPLRAIVECPKLEVEIGTPLLRRCFKNTYKISYCNKGTLAAEDAKITLEFPDEMIPLESSMEALQEGNQWTFDLGMVDIGECGFFTVMDSISCETDLGSTICLKSSILPNDPCEIPSALWDGSNIEVKGECLGDHLRFTLKNIGSGNMNEERNFYVYENNTLTETGKIQLKSQERLQLNLNPNDKALRLKVEQSPHFPITEDQPQTTVEACGESNFSYGYINSVEQNDRYPSVDIDCQEIIGSFDPNDIQVYPTGISDQHFIEENTKLTYKIRFQNTGSDTAFRVMIVDTLPPELEGASLNLGNSSHDYTFDIKFGNLLVWTFDNILLPDSTTNERESHGFVQFSISPKTGIELGTRIENKADIYFDFNAPIATNEVFNTVTDDLETDYGTPLTLYHLFIDFTTKLLDNGRIEVQWVTVNTGQISHFEIERSPNPHLFEAVHTTSVKESEDEFHLYQFEDDYDGNENILYYRIKAVDITGNHEYTLIRTVYLENKPAQYEVWSSNRKQTLIEWLGEKDETYTIRVFNTAGQYLWDFDVYSFHSVMPPLDSNLYILQVIDSQGKMIKTKKFFGL